MDKPSKYRTTVRFPPQVKQELAQAAHEDDRPVAYVIVQLVMDGLARRNRQKRRRRKAGDSWQ